MSEMKLIFAQLNWRIVMSQIIASAFKFANFSIRMATILMPVTPFDTSYTHNIF